MNKQVHVDRRLSSASIARHLITIVVCSSLVPAAHAAHAASAQERERGGKEVAETVCAVCHRTGEKGAPKIGDRNAWAKLTSKGLTGLTVVALKGIRKMPPHGGNPDLTDTEIERAITYMVNQSGGNWIEPASKLAVQRSGGEVVQEYCAKCHQTGAEGAPRIGDRAAWIPRLKLGVEVLVGSAIKGHGPMPARGNVAGLTDTEIRAAIAYMINGGIATATRPSVALAAGPDSDRQTDDGAGIYAGTVRRLRLFWTRIWGNSEIPK